MSRPWNTLERSHLACHLIPAFTNVTTGTLEPQNRAAMANLSKKAGLTQARRKALEALGFLAVDFIVDPKTKRVTMTRYQYNPPLIEEIQAERAEFSSAQVDGD